MRRLAPLAVLAPIVSALLALSGMTPAGAAVPLSGVVSATPVPWTPNVSAGTTNSTVCQQFFAASCSGATVLSTAVVNGEVVVVGAFTQVCQQGTATGHCKAGTTVTRDDIFAYQPGTGAIDPNFVPTLDKGPVYSVVAGPNNTVYVGGAFTTVNGASHHGIVQLQVTPGTAATDGQPVSGFKANVSNTVLRVALNGDALYLGGQFTSADSTKVTDLVRVNATTGALDPTFSVTLSNPVMGKTAPLPLKVESMALSPTGSTLAIGGTFQDVCTGTPCTGLSHPRMAMISTGGGFGSTATLDAWNAPILANNCSSEHDYVRGLDFDPLSSYVVAVTTGANSSPSKSASICDSAARFPASGSALTSTTVAPTWVNYTGRDSLYSVQITGGVVYVGGHNRWINNECGGDNRCELNSVLTMGISAIDANTGLALPWWHPMTLRGLGIEDLTAFPAGLSSVPNGGLLVGDNTTQHGGTYHSFNALFPLTSTTTAPTFGSIPSGIFLDGRPNGFDENNIGTPAMCVDDPANSATPGTIVDFSTCTNGTGQNWTVQTTTTPPKVNVTINGLCLDTVGGAIISGTKVDINTCSTSSTTQEWTQGPGNTLVNTANPTLCLTDPSSATTNGTQLDIEACPTTTIPASQVWPLPAAPQPASLVPTGPVQLGALQSNTQPACLTDNGNSSTPGTAAVVSTCIGSTPENFAIQSGGTIQINGLCLDTKGGAVASGTQVVLNTCNVSAATQVWTQQGPGQTLVNKAANLCLNAASSGNGSALTIATCSTTSSLQKWWLATV